MRFSFHLWWTLGALFANLDPAVRLFHFDLLRLLLMLSPHACSGHLFSVSLQYM
jgi:hypothetical protein